MLSLMLHLCYWLPTDHLVKNRPNQKPHKLDQMSNIFSQKLTLTYLKTPSNWTRWYDCFRCDLVWAQSSQTLTHYSLFGNSKSTRSVCATDFRILYHCNSRWQSKLRLVAVAQNVCTPKVQLLLLLLQQAWQHHFMPKMGKANKYHISSSFSIRIFYTDSDSC